MCCCLPCCLGLPDKMCPEKCPLCISLMTILDIVGMGLSCVLVVLVATNLLEFNEEAQKISSSMSSQPSLLSNDWSGLKGNTYVYGFQLEDSRVMRRLRRASNGTDLQDINFSKFGVSVPRNKMKAFQETMDNFKYTLMTAIAIAALCILAYLSSFFYSISILCGSKFLLKPCKILRRRIHGEVSNSLF